MVSNNTNHDVVRSIRRETRPKKVPMDAKYLGLPLVPQGKKSQAFAPILEKLQSKLQGWKATLLLQAGHATHIKIVTQALLVYSMSMFPFPISLCYKLDSLMCKFWWG